MEFSQVSPVLVALAIYALAVPIPGPSTIAISRASIISGPRAGAAAAFGTTLGAVIYAAATLLGLNTLLVALPWALTLIQIAGGLYLVYLGLALIRAHIKNRDKGTEAGNDIDRMAGTQQSFSKAFLRGFYISIGNPKMAAFFFGLFAPAAGHSRNLIAQLTILAGVIVIDLVYHQVLARVVILASRSFARSSVGRWLDAAAGGLMTVFGVGLLINAMSRK